MDIVDQLWLPHLISNSKQILDPEDIIESSLSFSALKGPQSTKIQVLFQPHFFNGCRNMSFWNFPFEKFDCDFFLFIRSLPAESAILSGNITIDQDSQTPSELGLGKYPDIFITRVRVYPGISEKIPGYTRVSKIHYIRNKNHHL